jgi:hypothetical protein
MPAATWSSDEVYESEEGETRERDELEARFS